MTQRPRVVHLMDERISTLQIQRFRSFFEICAHRAAPLWSPPPIDDGDDAFETRTPLDPRDDDAHAATHSDRKTPTEPSPPQALDHLPFADRNDAFVKFDNFDID